MNGEPGIRRQDLRDPAVPLTDAMRRAMTSQDWMERDRRREHEVLELTAELRDRAEAEIEDLGLEAVVDQIASWVRHVLKVPDTLDLPLVLGPPVIDRWRQIARNLQDDNFGRYAQAALYVRELVRYDTGLRPRFKKPPISLDDFQAKQLYLGIDATSRQLADVAGLPWPRPRRRCRPRPTTPPARPPIDVAQRQRERDAYDREQIDRRNREHDERIRRALSDDDDA